MTHILSAFADRPAAEVAAARLRDAGFPSDRLRVMERPPPINEGSIVLDELATGGMVHSVEKLLDGLFGTVKPPRVADSYADAVAMSGAAVVVDTDDEAEALRAESMLKDAGASAVSLVPEPDPSSSTGG